MKSFFAGCFTVLATAPFIVYYLKKTPDAIYRITEKLIYIKSIYDVNIKKIKRHTLKLINDNIMDINSLFNNMEFIKDGIVILNSSKDTYESLDLPNGIIDYDFIIYNKYDINTEITHKKIIINNKEELTEDDFNVEESSVRLLLCEVNINDDKIKIDFKEKNINFYLVNNIITKDVLYYMLNKLKDYELPLDHDKNAIELSFIDDTAKEVELKNNTLLFKKSEYELIINS